ncbi:MAG: hypothetical protein IPL00_19265 [Gammaproteobacteria bacterium]|nr:hypothetical protein [Gammaproteobacteria bacterium]
MAALIIVPKPVSWRSYSTCLHGRVSGARIHLVMDNQHPLLQMLRGRPRVHEATTLRVTRRFPLHAETRQLALPRQKSKSAFSIGVWIGDCRIGIIYR